MTSDLLNELFKRTGAHLDQALRDVCARNQLAGPWEAQRLLSIVLGRAATLDEVEAVWRFTTYPDIVWPRCLVSEDIELTDFPWFFLPMEAGLSMGLTLQDNPR